MLKSFKWSVSRLAQDAPVPSSDPLGSWPRVRPSPQSWSVATLTTQHRRAALEFNMHFIHSFTWSFIFFILPTLTSVHGTCRLCQKHCSLYASEYEPCSACWSDLTGGRLADFPNDQLPLSLRLCRHSAPCRARMRLPRAVALAAPQWDARR